MAEASVWISNVARHVENVIHRLASNHSQVSTGRVNIIISLQSRHPERFSLLCVDHDLLKVPFILDVLFHVTLWQNYCYASYGFIQFYCYRI